MPAPQPLREPRLGAQTPHDQHQQDQLREQIASVTTAHPPQAYLAPGSSLQSETRLPIKYQADLVGPPSNPQATTPPADMGSSSDDSLTETSGSSHDEVLPGTIHAWIPHAVFDPEKKHFERDLSPQDILFRECPISSPTQPSTISCTWEDLPSQPSTYESHLGLILIHLSLSSPLISALISAYALACNLLLTLLVPLCLCTHRQPFRTSIISLLAPAVRLQLRLIKSPLPSASSPNPGRLAAVCILAPFYAVVVALSAWVAAVFWLYAAILGEPSEGIREGDAGQGEQDGRNAIRAVRRWWEGWLLWAL